MRPTKYPTFVLATDRNGTIGGGWIDYGKALCTKALQAHIEAGWNRLNTGVVVPGGPQHRRKEREPRMRKTNHVPWLGRTVIVAIMALVGLGAFAGPASAQNESIVLDNIAYWWDHLDCPKMINAVNAMNDAAHTLLSGHEAPAAAPFGDSDSEREWCGMWDQIGENQRRAIGAGAKDSTTSTNAEGSTARDAIVTKATDRVFDTRDWWDGMSSVGRRVAIGDYTYNADGTAGTQVAHAAYSTAPTGTVGKANLAYAALMSSGMMPPTTTDEEEAPALPLVGVGILGLLLAGRGAWLRRRA